jgi:hypothetical protein
MKKTFNFLPKNILAKHSEQYRQNQLFSLFSLSSFDFHNFKTSFYGTHFLAGKKE